MAALQKIRGQAGLLIGVLGVALLAFILSDFFTSGNAFFNKAKDKAFTVDGDVVSTGKYAERIEQWEFFEKTMSGRSSLDEAATSQIRERVYQQMVKEMMLDDQAEKLGLAVTPEELTDMVYGTNISPILYQIPLFTNPQTRQFDKAYLTEFLQNVKLDTSTLPQEQQEEHLMRKQLWAFIENMMKYQRLEEKYTSLVAGTILVNDAEAKSYYNDSKNIANISYVVEKYTALSDSSVTVSDDELKTLYNQRKNSYKLDTELRKISYFIKDVVPSEEDYAEVEKEMNVAFEKLKASENPSSVVTEYSGNQYIDAFVSLSALPADAKAFAESSSIGQVYGPARDGQSFIMYKLIDKTIAPDSLRLQILPMPQGVDPKAAASIVDSIQNVIKGGESFTDIANKMSPGSNGGEIGWVNEMMLASAGIAKECFGASQGDVLKVTIGGQPQLVRIAEKTKPVAKVKLAMIQMPVLVSDKTQSAIDNELNLFVSENSNAENFDKAAQAKGYGLVPNALITPSDIGLGQSTGTRSVIHWAFNNKVGTVKKFDEMADKRVVAIIKGEINDPYTPFSELKESLKAELIRDKKSEKIIADLKSKNLTSLDAYAQALDTRVDTAKFVTFQTNNIVGVGFEPVLNTYSKVGQVNKLTDPVKGVLGVYILNILDKTEDTKEFDADQAKQTLRQNNYYQILSQSVMALKGKMDVKDNRVAFW